ncbi:reverse transcriptase domain-containing protein [Tanacetum coccineum]
MNAHADALSKLTALSFEHLSKDILVDIIKEKSILQPLKVSYAETDDTWMTPIFSYQYHDILSLNKVDSLRIWRKAIMRMCGIHLGYRAIAEKALLMGYCWPTVNQDVEVANKEIVKGIKKRMEEYKIFWVDELSSVPWAHRTTPKESIGETPFSVVYDTEAVIPIEVPIHTELVAMVTDDKNENSRRLDLALAEEKMQSSDHPPSTL